MSERKIKIMDALSFLDDSYVEEADTYDKNARRRGKTSLKVCAAAACFAVVICAAFMIPYFTDETPQQLTDGSETTEAQNETADLTLPPQNNDGEIIQVDYNVSFDEGDAPEFIDEKTMMPDKVRVYQIEERESDQYQNLKRYVSILYGEDAVKEENFVFGEYDFKGGFYDTWSYFADDDPYIRAENIHTETGEISEKRRMITTNSSKVSIQLSGLTPSENEVDVLQNDPFEYVKAIPHCKAAFEYMGFDEMSVTKVKWWDHTSPTDMNKVIGESTFFVVTSKGGNGVEDTFNYATQGKIEILLSWSIDKDQRRATAYIKIDKYADEVKHYGDYKVKNYEDAKAEMYEKYRPERFSSVNLDDIKATVNYKRYYTDSGEVLLVPYYLFYFGSTEDVRLYCNGINQISRFETPLVEGLPSGHCIEAE